MRNKDMFGILTFYNEHNYGAVLQAYALQHRIKQLGYKSEFIDYREHIPTHQGTNSSNSKRLFNRFKTLIKLHKYLRVRSTMSGNLTCFRNFQNTHLNVAKQPLYDYEDLVNIASLYHGFIAGSDMVWTPIGQDLDYYFMRFAPYEKRLSYAASLTGVKEFDKEIENKICRYISEIKSIACREQEGVNYVIEKTGNNAIRTIDPTLLLTKEEWIKTLDIQKSQEDKYILCYMFKGMPKSMEKEVSRISRENRLKIRYIPMNIEEYYQEVSNGYSGAYGPKEFVELFMNASFVITNSFHGFLFSLIAKKPFVVIHREKGNVWKGNEGRISNLLELIDLSGRYLEWDAKISEEFLSLDYSNDIDKRIEMLRQSSITYLHKMLLDASKNECDIVNDYSKVTDLNPKKCTGCETCVNVCPKECISMIPNEEGFLYPHIDMEKCFNCGKCIKTCPSVQECSFRSAPKECYAALSNIKEVEQSSSGGLFVTAAKYIIEDCKGVVFGVILDESTFECKYSEADSIEKLSPMQGSKYIQAHVGDVYSKVRRYLVDGRVVLFSGTPCQIAGLKSFLGKTYDRLYTIDIICHGVPSQLYWQKYIENTFPKNTLQSYRFRNREAKRNGRTSLERVSLANGVRKEKNAWDDIYYGTFVENESFRLSCYYCKFANGRRCGDLTMGDFDSTSQMPDFHPTECKSVVTINNEQGLKLWENISELFGKVDISFAQEAAVNCTLSHPSPMPSKRRTLYNDLKSMEWKEFATKYSHKLPFSNRVKLFIIKLLH